MIICIQCAMEAMLADTPYPGESDPTMEAHLARAHPDLAVTKARRVELERLLDAKMRDRA